MVPPLPLAPGSSSPPEGDRAPAEGEGRAPDVAEGEDLPHGDVIRSRNPWIGDGVPDYGVDLVGRSGDGPPCEGERGDDLFQLSEVGSYDRDPDSPPTLGDLAGYLVISKDVRHPGEFLDCGYVVGGKGCSPPHWADKDRRCPET